MFNKIIVFWFLKHFRKLSKKVTSRIIEKQN